MFEFLGATATTLEECSPEQRPFPEGTWRVTTTASFNSTKKADAPDYATPSLIITYKGVADPNEEDNRHVGCGLTTFLNMPPTREQWEVMEEEPRGWAQKNFGRLRFTLGQLLGLDPKDPDSLPIVDSVIADVENKLFDLTDLVGDATFSKVIVKDNKSRQYLRGFELLENKPPMWATGEDEDTDDGTFSRIF